jgi:hypothetical protein
MNFITKLLDPFTSGYIYGTTIASTTENIKKNADEAPIITAIDIIATGWVYGYASELISKNVNTKAKYVASGVLLSVVGYKIYKFLKKKYVKISDNVICEENKENKENKEAMEAIEDTNSEITNCTKEDCIICECIDNMLNS